MHIFFATKAINSKIVIISFINGILAVIASYHPRHNYYTVLCTVYHINPSIKRSLTYPIPCFGKRPFSNHPSIFFLVRNSDLTAPRSIPLHTGERERSQHDQVRRPALVFHLKKTAIDTKTRSRKKWQKKERNRYFPMSPMALPLVIAK